jgi:hypothetical protein
MRFLIPLVLAALSFGCKVQDYASPAQAAAILTADEAYDKALEDLRAIDGDIEETKEVLKEATLTGDTALAAAALEEFDALSAAYGQALQELTASKASAEAVEAEVFEDEVTASRVLADQVLPGSGVLIGAFAPMVLGLFAARSRKRTMEALKYTSKRQLDQALVAFARALGWRHSDDEPQALLQRAKKLAHEQGDKELAVKIDRTFPKATSA